MSSRLQNRPSNDDEGDPVKPLLYAGQDTRPTSRQELLGWYMYAFAAETYVICGIGSFIPILLESLARENGVLISDPTKPCGSSSGKDSTGGGGDGQCVVYLPGGLEINTASFAMYTFAISVLLQALLVVSISCAADHGDYRKKLLLIFAWVGSASVMAYIFISKETYVLGALLTIISNTCFGASFVLLNSFLPLLVRNHPEVIEARRSQRQAATGSARVSFEEPGSSSLVDSTSTLLGEDGSSPAMSDQQQHQPRRREGHPSKNWIGDEITSTELQLSTKISARGIGTGYSAALFLQCLSIAVLIVMDNTTWSQRIVLCMVGLWWTIFTIPAAMWLRSRPGPPLLSDNDGNGGKSRNHYMAWLSYFIYAWKSIFKTMQLARRLLDIMLFLGGWFLLSDAIATTSSTAILFAKTTLHMRPWALGMINVITTLFGVFGAFGWSWISRRFQLQPHQTILVCIALFELIPLYGLLGYIGFVRSWGVFGLQQPWEMYPLAAIYGLVLGGLSGYCRSLFGELIPPGSEAAFYALYAMTDKGSSVFGPSIVGAIIDKTGSIRPAFWFLSALVGFPAVFFYFIDVARGKREGVKLAAAIVRAAHATDAAAVGAEADLGMSSEGVESSESRAMLADYEA